jgi:DNA-binding NtrC family response regulator
MQHRVLVIENQHQAEFGSVSDVLGRTGAVDCRRLGWEQVDRQHLVGDDDDLIVAVGSRSEPRMPGVFEWLADHPISAPVIAVLPDLVDEALVRLVLQTADDFIFPPLREIEVRYRVERILGSPRSTLDTARTQLIREHGLTSLVGRDAAFRRSIENLPRYAMSDYSVLITGETGTGKELCARALHHLGKRRNLPFIAVDCGAIPEQLFENELFGHARGAFTDAHRDHRGLIAMAEGGTLLLDEIDALSLASQAKLLRFLQEKTYRQLGSDRFQRADVRVLAATNRDLHACVQRREFRSDLYFRLNILNIHLPALRQRPGDIQLLAQHFLQEHATSDPPAPTSFSMGSMRLLSSHQWPGNVRELCNVVQRAIVACDGDRVLPCHLDIIGDHNPSAEPGEGGFREARAAAVEAFERRYVEELLRKHNGNVTRAAREAHQDRRAFGRFVKKYRIDRHLL